MQAKTFRAPTIAEAYQLVREELGPDALILSTRAGVGSGPLGLRNRSSVEVTAGLPEEGDTGAELSLEAQEIAHTQLRETAEGLAARGLTAAEVAAISLRAQQLSRPAGVEDEAPAGTYAQSAYAQSAYARAAMGAFDAQPPLAPARPSVALDDESDGLAPPFVHPLAGQGVEAVGGPLGRFEDTPDDVDELRDSRGFAPAGPSLHELVNEVAGLRAAVERLAERDMEQRLEAGPQPLRDIRAQLEANDLGGAVVVPLMERLEASLTEDASPEAIWRAAARRLAATLPPPVAIDVTRRSSAIVLVGPSGAGKTTAAVRIALELERRGLVAVIAGTDVDRAGAPQQLEAFAAAAGIPAQLCYTPAEVQELIESGEADVVIMDTPGHDGSRVAHMAELNAFLRILDEPTVLLTLPATTRAADLQRIQRAYASVEPRGLVVTRCDEASAFGGIATVAVQSQLGVAFTTHDASGPEAMHSGDNHALATAVLRGGWPSADRRPPAREARVRAS